MPQPVIAATGLFTPPEAISNAELVDAFNQYVRMTNLSRKSDIDAGRVSPLQESSAEFIKKASGIEQRYVLNKTGILDPSRMAPMLEARGNDDLSYMAEIGLSAATQALTKAQVEPSQIDLIIVAASNMERAYPAISVEIQAALGASGMAFDMNVACASAPFALRVASDMIRAGSIRSALIVNPEICSAHLDFTDRDCHFIFGDAATAMVVTDESLASQGYRIHDVSCATQFSNNIRNNAGFLNRTGAQGTSMRDKLFVQQGRMVFKQVTPLVKGHVTAQLTRSGWAAGELDRLWMHQANESMNHLIATKILGAAPTPDKMPLVLAQYANTSSAGSVIALHLNPLEQSGQRGILSAFGAGYSVGSALLEAL